VVSSKYQAGLGGLGDGSVCTSLPLRRGQLWKEPGSPGQHQRDHDVWGLPERPVCVALVWQLGRAEGPGPTGLDDCC